jgi:hypothetical protein
VEGSSPLGFPVVHRGIELGRVTGLLEDAAGGVVAFRVRCGDGVVRLLPAHAATAVDKALTVFSALALLDEEQADFYRREERA